MGSTHQILEREGEVLHLIFRMLQLDVRARRSKKGPSEELANESRSRHITVAADMVFSLSHYLSGVCRFPLYRKHYSTLNLLLIDCYCGLCPCIVQRILGRNSVIRIVPTSEAVQSSEIGGYLLLQYVQNTT